MRKPRARVELTRGRLIFEAPSPFCKRRVDLSAEQSTAETRRRREDQIRIFTSHRLRVWTVINCSGLNRSVPISTEAFELEPSTGRRPIADERPRLEPLPAVRLVSVDDVRLPTMPGLAEAMTSFYVTIVELLAEDALTFRAENFRLRFDERMEKPVERDTVKPLGIQVPSLVNAERRLVNAEIEYIREVGLTPGRRAILVQDPAGNWLELFDSRVLG